jgi:hypothetical protein
MTDIMQSSSKRQADRLHQDHRALEALFELVLESARANDGPTLSILWSEFERRLETHLEGENAYLLSALEPMHPGAVETVRKHHGTLRRLTASIGIETDLHAVRISALEEVGRLLREYATFEERTIYAWARQSIDSLSLEAFLQHIRERTPLLH